LECWPTAGLQGELSQVLPVPAHFEQATQVLKEEDIAKEIICGADVEKHLQKLNEYLEAGYTHVWIHQVGTDQEGFFQFYEQEVLPQFARHASTTKKPQTKAARSSSSKS
jgi:coenzyme F420-dependent glucose-6-phosphate dehydrogenase